jgi:Caspase domain
MAGHSRRRGVSIKSPHRGRRGQRRVGAPPGTLRRTLDADARLHNCGRSHQRPSHAVCGAMWRAGYTLYEPEWVPAGGAGGGAPCHRMKVASASRSLTRGLARIEPENNSLVAYAAKGGQIAQDGLGDHSPFTSALIRHITVPGLDIRLALGRVRDEVLKNTAYKQEPTTSELVPPLACVGSIGRRIAASPMPRQRPAWISARGRKQARASRTGSRNDGC